MPHEGKLDNLDRDTRRRFKRWLSDYCEHTAPVDTKAWEFLKELSRLEDRDAIKDGKNPDEVYQRNALFNRETMKHVKIVSWKNEPCWWED